MNPAMIPSLFTTGMSLCSAFHLQYWGLWSCRHVVSLLLEGKPASTAPILDHVLINWKSSSIWKFEGCRMCVSPFVMTQYSPWQKESEPCRIVNLSASLSIRASVLKVGLEYTASPKWGPGQITNTTTTIKGFIPFAEWWSEGAKFCSQCGSTMAWPTPPSLWLAQIHQLEGTRAEIYLDFPEIRGFPFQKATFWGEVVWGRYNLTRYILPKNAAEEKDCFSKS